MGKCEPGERDCASAKREVHSLVRQSAHAPMGSVPNKEGILCLEGGRALLHYDTTK